MRVIYVAGRFSAPDQWQRARNVRAAEVVAFAVAQAGAMPLNPLAITHNFYGTLDEEKLWYPGTLELMRRCDAMILVPGWEGSKGVTAEVEEAKRIGLRVFERVDELKAWLAPRNPPPTGAGFAPYPKDKPPRHNGGVLCDMWKGPCACGAWHDGDNDVLERR